MDATNNPNFIKESSLPAGAAPRYAKVRRHWIVRLCRIGLVALVAVVNGFAVAGTPDAAALAQRYEELFPRMAASPFDRRLIVDSDESDGRMRGVVNGELAEPFAPMAARLVTARAWCDVIVLHINVKGCHVERTEAGEFITVYSGRKFYEPIASTNAIRYTFRVAAAAPDYLKVELTAREGPLGTRDYELVLEAMPIEGHAFVALRYGFRPSAASRLAMVSYLATAGSDKAGFTVVGRRVDGRPMLVGGIRGIVERNAMRNFLALESWLATCDVADGDRFERRLQRMAVSTERYPLQLVEMSTDEYLAIKRREWRENSERERTASL